MINAVGHGNGDEAATDIIKIAVTPPIQVGGSLFTPDQMVKIGAVLGSNSNIEMTPFGQLYVEVAMDRREEIQEELERSGGRDCDAYAIEGWLCRLCTWNK